MREGRAMAGHLHQVDKGFVIETSEEGPSAPADSVTALKRSTSMHETPVEPDSIKRQRLWHAMSQVLETEKQVGGHGNTIA